MPNGAKPFEVGLKKFVAHTVGKVAGVDTTFETDTSAVLVAVLSPDSGAGTVSLGAADGSTGLKTVTLTGGSGDHVIAVGHGTSVNTVIPIRSEGGS